MTEVEYHATIAMFGVLFVGYFVTSHIIEACRSARIPRMSFAERAVLAILFSLSAPIVLSELPAILGGSINWLSDPTPWKFNYNEIIGSSRRTGLIIFMLALIGFACSIEKITTKRDL